MEAYLSHIEKEFATFSISHPQGFSSLDQKFYYMALKFKRRKILYEKELSIWLKIRAIWLQHKYENTKYFHNFYQNGISNNTIWHLDNRVV